MIPNDEVRLAILVTHLNCLDGAGCEIAFRRAGGRKENIKRVAAGKFDKFYSENWTSFDRNPLIVADVFPAQEKTWKDLATRTTPTYVLDHHISSAKFARCDQYPFFEYDSVRCGSRMLFDRLFDEEKVSTYTHLHCDFLKLKELIDLIDRHDRWIDVDERVENMALFNRVVGIDEFVDRFVEDPSMQFKQDEEFLIKHERRRLDAKMRKVVNNVFLSEVMEAPFDGLTVAVAITTEDTSRLLNRVLEKHERADIAIGVNPEDNSISLRSRPGGPSCARIAEKLGGGGHDRAAGFVSKMKCCKLIAENI